MTEMVKAIHTLSFFVSGDPVPQGSTKSYHNKKLDKVFTTHGNKNTDRWRLRIATEAQAAVALNPKAWPWWEDREAGYRITAMFSFKKPASARKRKTMNNKRPDIDKLERALLDAITDVLIPDDALVISSLCEKDYVVDGDGRSPGVKVTITRFVED
jgi:crossover junction endodeoxyribonuclease RusA